MRTCSLLACAVACMSLPAMAQEPLPAGFHHAIVHGWIEPAGNALDSAKPLLKVEFPTDISTSTDQHSPLSEPLQDII